MMDAIRIRTTVTQSGELTLTDLPFEPGQEIEVILLVEEKSKKLTAAELARSEIVGLWADRDDIEDSSAYARQLREQAQRR